MISADRGRVPILAQTDHVLQVGGLAFAVVVQRKGAFFRGGPLEGFGSEYIGSHWGQVKSAIILKKTDNYTIRCEMCLFCCLL